MGLELQVTTRASALGVLGACAFTLARVAHLQKETMTDKDWDVSEIAPGKAVQKWADESMFTAEPATSTVPRARLVDAPADPLGKLAFIAKAYQGVFPESYATISDADRRYYIQDMEKNILGMPSESVMFHFVLENVTRSFTHQLVRTRHASYAQESMRFAVKEDFPVQLPPYLHGTLTREDWRNEHLQGGIFTSENSILEYEERYADERQRARFLWDETVAFTGDNYATMIELGMPAEDARGLAPHNIVTKLNWVIDLRSLMAVAGQRLCTQAQFEHRVVWNSIIQEIYNFGDSVSYQTNDIDPAERFHYTEVGNRDGDLIYERSSQWQFDLLAARFQPICYQTGGCKFGSDFDRYCNIRDRVNANESINRPSKEWGEPYLVDVSPVTQQVELGIPAIHPREWLSSNAAIAPTGDWRSTEAQDNINGRRR